MVTSAGVGGRVRGIEMDCMSGAGVMLWSMEMNPVLW